MATVEGKCGIKATVLKRSRSAITGIEFVTYEIEYPRIILAELNTHKMLSKNSASSRAIPFEKMLTQLHGRPVRFGQANPGMQDKGEDFDARIKIEPHLWGAYSAFLDWAHPYVSIEDCIDFDESGGTIVVEAQTAWEFARFLSVEMAKGFYEAGYHKQVYNRLLEPFQMMKTVISGTEWANFFWLRDHDAADPTIAELARVMYKAKCMSEVQVLGPGEWHLPYLDMWRDQGGLLHYGELVGASSHGVNDEWVDYPLEDAIKISCARCAAVSFRNVDYGLKKSREVYARLVGDDRKHASAFEHCGTPMSDRAKDSKFGGADVNLPIRPDTWEEGITHMDREYNLWSGNLKGWIQYRKLIPGENYTGH